MAVTHAEWLLAGVTPGASSEVASGAALEAAPALVHYLPVASTAVSAAFLVALLRRAMVKDWPPHLNWWAVGVFFYGVGTGLESAVTLAGNTLLLTKLWYIAGAILGGYPLATGTVYLLLKRRTANVLTALSLVVVIGATVAIALSPMDASALEPHRPTPDALGWQWARSLTPFINIYAALFLVGGAVLSSWRFARHVGDGRRALGTAFIAVGGLLPGIGGTLTKTHGVVEALYVGELVGIVFIWIGFELTTRAKRAVRVARSGGEMAERGDEG